MGISQRDSQFIESKEISVQDICRFFGVPLYKVQAGKQSYASNEHNSIEYVTNTLTPTVTQYEEEFTYKLFTDSEIKRGLEVKGNMNAELRGAYTARAQFYKSMREIGAYSANDIRSLEDEPNIEGGDTYYASLNYVPLEDFKKLSLARNLKQAAQTEGGEEE
jgi:HK97 family phage portal protein